MGLPWHNNASEMFVNLNIINKFIKSFGELLRVFVHGFLSRITIRQGGIVSPTLFFIYMDDLSFILSESGIGCHINDLCINHVFYADDLCLMAPCAIALQELIGLCYEYSVVIDLNFNATKSYCVALITPKLYKLALPSLHINHLLISY